jgi:hypothetical protein
VTGESRQRSARRRTEPGAGKPQGVFVRSRPHRATNSGATGATRAVLLDLGWSGSWFSFRVGQSPFLQEDPLPGRSATRARVDRPRRYGPVKTGNCRGRAPVDRRAVRWELVVCRSRSRGDSSATTPRAVIAERQRGREGLRVYLCDAGFALSDRPRPLPGMMTFRRR